MSELGYSSSRPGEAYIGAMLRFGPLRSLRHRLAAFLGKRHPSVLLWLTNRHTQDRVSVRLVAGRIAVMNRQAGQLIFLSRDHGVYVPLVAESFDYFFSSAVSSQVTVDGASYQSLDFSRPTDQSVIGFPDFPIMSPSLTEPFVTTEQYLEFAGLGPGQVAIDLGAYSALSSIAFSKVVGAEGRVVALEPDPVNLAAAMINLQRNVDINALVNIRLIQAAVAAKPGTIALSAEGSMGSATADLVGKHRGATIAVRAMTLEEIVTEEKLDRIDFIKFDIEGSEKPVILSSGELLTRFRPRLIIEPHFVDGTSTATSIISFLEGIGYDCQIIAQTGLVHLPLLCATPARVR